ncbi:hypothetical protein IU500_09665 [Nocardia terpenica]|uniref:hypothetical protein n=1 Tax=Nocardia terpenica TaxID=455432 RepID=UPI00189309DC|nr:hypothetical protein [Nocardia terpenica]MBF6062220.1 hypothetical protein [Nocardia terpenica]MBF6104308.1 hypothetical protein [Nocardia terpenica]MBF6109836.1 hypothetical protein [Nocardia terpenica]MBF6120142.1 hypothetical protein [Nocardia terpenica]MBF6152553.1 hypothetical protein [Nocardia terpenica]
MALEDIARELYGLDPGEFTAARTARVERARAAGDKRLATAIGRLRRPTVAAWAVNLLARQAPDEVSGLLDLGAALRDAQRTLSGDRLRTLTAQRQQVVNALARKAGGLATEHGRALSEGVLREVGQTLHAALADPEVGERVRDGVVTTAVNYEGFGTTGPSLTAVPGVSETDRTARPETGTAQRKADASERKAEAARRELEEALVTLESARSARDSAQDEVRRSAAEREDLSKRIDSLRAELARIEDQRRFAASAERSAREALHKAERQLDRAQRWVDKAQARIQDDPAHT